MFKSEKVKGVFWNSLGSTMYGANSFIMLVAVSCFGTVEQTGAFGIAFTTAQMLYIIGLFGVSHYHMTDYSEKFHFIDYVQVRVLSIALVIVCCGVSVLVLGFSGEKALYLVMLTVLMILNVVGDLYQSLFFQKNRLDLSGSALFFRTLWPLLLFCGVLTFTRNVILALFFQITANLVITIYYAVKVAPQFLLAKEGGRATEQIWAIIKECSPLLGSLLFMGFILNFSKYGVEFMMDDAAQGYYNMIFMPAQVINLCSQFLFQPFLNQYSQLLQGRHIKIVFLLLLRQVAWVAGLTIICCGGAFWLGTPALGFLYQKDLAGLAPALTLVVFGGGIFALCQLFYYIFVILRRQTYVLAIYIPALLLAVFPTAALINRFGLSGAALSFAVVHALILLAYASILIFLLRGYTDA